MMNWFRILVHEEVGPQKERPCQYFSLLLQLTEREVPAQKIRYSVISSASLK